MALTETKTTQRYRLETELPSLGPTPSNAETFVWTSPITKAKQGISQCWAEDDLVKKVVLLACLANIAVRTFGIADGLWRAGLAFAVLEHTTITGLLIRTERDGTAKPKHNCCVAYNSHNQSRPTQ